MAAAFKVEADLAANMFTAAVIVCLPLLVFLANFALLLSSDSYLHSLYSSTAILYNLQPRMQPEIAAAVSADVIAYVKGDKPQIRYASYFRPEELSHLAGVRNRVSASFAALYILAAAVAVSLFGLFAACGKFNAFAAAVKTALLRGGIVTVAFAGVLFLASLGFGSAFIAFHSVVFPNSQWQFPSHYLLVNLFTTEFFAKFAKGVVIAAFIQGLAVFLAALVIGKFYNAKKILAKA